jgi:hypothetical protein
MPDGNGAMHALQAPPAGWVSPSICAAAAAASQQLLHSGCPLSSLFTKFISNSFLHTVLPLCKSFRHLAIVGSRTVLVKILSQSLGRVQRHPAWTRLSSMLHGDRLWSWLLQTALAWQDFLSWEEEMRKTRKFYFHSKQTTSILGRSKAEETTTTKRQSWDGRHELLVTAVSIRG